MKTICALLISLFLCFGAFANTKNITLTNDNTVVLKDGIDFKTVGPVMQQIRELDSKLKSGYPIYLVLYTPGGSIQSGLELMEFVNGINRPIHTITLFAASMGFQFVQHMGKRYIIEYGTLMSHKARGGFQGEFGGGFSQLDSRYGLWLRRIDMMDKQTVKRTKGKQTLKSYRDAYASELWLNGPEAVAQGYADEVIVPKCDSSLQNPQYENLRFGRVVVRVSWSKCPLIIAPLTIEISLYTNQGLMKLDEFLSKNGKFGTCQEKTDSYSYKYNISSDITETKNEQLCASDPKITLDKLEQLAEQQRQHYTRDFKKHIIYSY